MRYVIYSLSDPRTGDVRYVGYSTNFRKRIQHHINQAKRNYWTGNSYKDNWLRALLALGLKPLARILEVGEGDPAPDERKWIAFYRAMSPKMINRLDGGQGGAQCLTEDGRERIRQSKLGVPRSDEARAKMSAAMTPERKERLRAMKLGVSRTIEVRAKIAIAKTGQQLSDETKAKISATLIGNQRAVGNDPWKNRRSVVAE